MFWIGISENDFFGINKINILLINIFDRGNDLLCELFF